jgi:hypothetical protein
MTEPTPPNQPSGPKRIIARISWHRFSLYAGSIAVILALWICAVLYTIRYHPDRFIDRLLAEMPFPSSHGEVAWRGRRTLEIKDLMLGKFFFADAIIISASPWGLLQAHVARLEVNGAQVYTAPLAELMERTSLEGGAGLDWTIGSLEINRGTVFLQDVVPDLPAIPVRLGVQTPLVVRNLRLSKPDDSPDMNRLLRLEIENVVVISPLDPLTRVLSFPLIRLHFTYAELWQHRIREIDLVRPVIYLGQDLFWFSEQFTKQSAAQSSSGGVEAPWYLGHLEVQYGQLALNAFGQEAVTLPFFFKAEINNIRSDQVGKISAKTTMPIVRFDQDYPDYKVRIVNLHGNLNFSVPPSNVHANNIVPTIFIDRLSWNSIPATEVWTSVDFDPTGIFADLGGKCEGGYVRGNFEIYYTKGFAWNGNLFAQNLNIRPVTEKLVGKYVDLTGELDGKLTVQGQATEILNCHGSLTLPKPGVLEIKSMENLLKRLPKPLAIQDQAMKIMVHSFQTYPYQNGELKIDYQPTGGVGSLKLKSPLGGRQLEVHWHPDESEKSSKVANDADNR